jgi:hypothetical protein
MRLVVIMGVAAGLLTSGCGQTVPPVAAATKTVPTKSAPAKPAPNAPCGDRFSDADCQQGTGCRWIAAHKRGDGTYATAYCLGVRRR